MRSHLFDQLRPITLYVPSSEATVRNFSETKSCLSMSSTIFQRLSNFFSAPMSADAIFSNKQVAHKASVTRGTYEGKNTNYEYITQYHWQLKTT